jgi:hypothetical protein
VQRAATQHAVGWDHRRQEAVLNEPDAAAVTAAELSCAVGRRPETL